MSRNPKVTGSPGKSNLHTANARSKTPPHSTSKSSTEEARPMKTSLTLILASIAVLALATVLTGSRFLEGFKASTTNTKSIQQTQQPSILHEKSAVSNDALTTSRTMEPWKSHPFSIQSSSNLPVWGSYRPDIYFGMKTRTAPSAMYTGLLWSVENKQQRGRYRYSTATDEAKFDWLVHNGRNFGVERIIDAEYGLKINASFVTEVPKSSAGSALEMVWMQRLNVARRSVNRLNEKLISIFTFGVDEVFLSNFSLNKVKVHEDNREIEILGTTLNGKYFVLSLQVMAHGTDASLSFSGRAGKSITDGVDDLFSDLSQLTLNNDPLPASRQLDNIIEPSSSFLAVQVSSVSEFTLDVTFRECSTCADFDDLSSLVSNVQNSQNTEDETLTTVEEFSAIQQLVAVREREFDIQFESKFNLASRNLANNSREFAHKDILVAKRALSSLLGGVGHFYGHPNVEQAEDSNDGKRGEKVSVLSPDPISLFTGTPSRTSFPRGFLWDEGFHQLLALQWDVDVTLKVLGDWLSAQYSVPATAGEVEACEKSTSSPHCSSLDTPRGWIPREMILGASARKRVPGEFIVQRTNIANPPSFLLVVNQLIDRLIRLQASTADESDGDRNSSNSEEIAKISSFLVEAHPALVSWMNWFLWSQKSTDGSNGFRWRGRSTADNKLLANTLASGLDDYPRSPLPSDDELHLDLLCWMVKSTQILAKLETYLRQHSLLPPAVNVAEGFDELSNVFAESLATLHWSDELQGYFDVGLYSKSSEISSQVLIRCQSSTGASIIHPIAGNMLNSPKLRSSCPKEFPQFAFVMGDGAGNYLMKDVLKLGPVSVQHVPHIGYVSIFPLLLQLEDPQSPRLVSILQTLADSRHLWTKFGLRSLSTKDQFYDVSNAQGDNPYWRGPIWMNINYLAIAALKHYSAIPGPAQALASDLYSSLRANVMRNVIKEYERTGYFWEHYDDKTGKGYRGHPFSGWTALVVNIMAERYD